MRGVVWVAMLGMLLVAASVHAQQDSSSALDRVHLEARQLLQGIPSSRFLDSLDIERLARALLDIRSAVPEVRGISNYGDDSRLVLHLSEVGQGKLDTLPTRRSPGENTRTFTRLGIASIDSLDQVFEADSVEVVYLVGRAWEVRPYLARAPNVPILARAYDSLPEVDYAGPPIYVGDGDWVGHFRKKGLWYFVFSSGTGDCPSGCIVRDFYYVTYVPETRQTTLVDSLMDGKFNVATVHTWDIPSRVSVQPYDDYADLRSQATDTRWWVRHHAVAVLDYMVGKPEGPWHGDSFQDKAHFQELMQAVEAHWTEVLLLLCDRVADEDDWVRTTARHALVHVTSLDYGEGEVARERWAEWVRGRGEGEGVDTTLKLADEFSAQLARRE